MIKINTYLKKQVIISSLENINEEMERYFVPLKSKVDLCYIDDFDYIEGAITICSDEKYILDFRHWDLVDQLWVYLLHATYEMLTQKKEVKFYFPDQPIEFKMKLVSDYAILLSVKGEKHVVNSKEFLEALLDGGQHFFAILYQCKNGQTISRSREELELIKEVGNLVGLHFI
ncbi:MAG: hypothetical protein IKK33_08355 [Lachnospiraceae bacterium]|nr:hypothetical protein [Lachnospiraceae bacterium]